MRSLSPSTIKKHLAKNGWSQRQAAKELGRCYQHVNQVLNGTRSSQALLAALAKLPEKEAATK